MSDTLTAGGHREIEDYEYELTALESRADADSLEALHDERRKLIAANGRLIALHGSFGLFDNYRKRMCECEKVRIRNELRSAGTKTTESMIDAEAHGSEPYGQFLDTALNEKIEWLRVSTRLEEIAERIRGRELALRAFSAEASLR